VAEQEKGEAVTWRDCDSGLVYLMHRLVFVVSLLLPFALLYFLSSLLNSALLAAGYDISRLILLGLPDGPTIMSAPIVVDAAAATLNFVDLAKSPAVIFTAVILATSAAYKFLYSGQSIPPALDIYSPLPRTP